MKIALNYNSVTGGITTNSGELVAVYAGLETHKLKEPPKQDIPKFVALGYSADDMIKLKEAGVL